jgi:hypothetical protein
MLIQLFFQSAVLCAYSSNHAPTLPRLENSAIRGMPETNPGDDTGCWILWFAPSTLFSHLEANHHPVVTRICVGIGWPKPQIRSAEWSVSSDLKLNAKGQN